MGICSNCFQKKPVLAPRCHHCNSDEGLLARLWWNAFYYGTIIVGFILIVIWLLS